MYQYEHIIFHYHFKVFIPPYLCEFSRIAPIYLFGFFLFLPLSSTRPPAAQH